MNQKSAVMACIYIVLVMLMFLGAHNVDNAMNMKNLEVQGFQGLCDWNFSNTRCFTTGQLYQTGMVMMQFSFILLAVLTAAIIFGEVIM